ncbi:restriction endonuclease [Tumidithrix elongata RA019]|uniref:Restriction endonuclease n=2 Tax=Tumidithrix TaxID=3088355 RepID=A0AAW9Q268_9CYAN|nr:restriction endonuclease [Tumidithrix elongata RA019]
MLPFMQFSSDRKEHSFREVTDYLIDEFKLSDEEKRELLPSGKQRIINNRVGWTSTHLKKAGLLESSKRSIIKITARGLEVLKSSPTRIDQKFLRQFKEYLEFVGVSNGTEKVVDVVEEQVTQDTPDEMLDFAYQKIRQALAQELLDKVKSCTPSFFEILVVELLVKMGYGGSIQDAGKAIGKSGDEGIDGIIKEDKLGLDVIYIQAKRWGGSVGRPEIQKFVGALAGQGANKGIFITTSTFTKDAKEYAPKNAAKIVLIDGEQLAQYMIDYNLAVSTVSTYEIKKIDSDYFADE